MGGEGEDRRSKEKTDDKGGQTVGQRGGRSQRCLTAEKDQREEEEAGGAESEIRIS